MKLISLKIDKFKSFKRPQTFNFPQSRGVYFISGRNDVQPDLEANGSGKSTLWDAVLWCLFGKTARNLRASNIIPWGEYKTAQVALEFEQDGVIYTLSRTQNPNTLKISESNNEFKDTLQEDIDHLLRLDFDGFLYSVIFGQFNESFFDLKPAAKQELFSSWMQLKNWEEYSTKAKQQESHLQGIYHDIVSAIAEDEGELKGIQQLDFSDLESQWDKEHQDQIDECKQEKLKSEKELVKLQDDGKKIYDELKKLRTELDEVDQGIEEFNEIINDIRKEEQGYRGVIIENKTTLKSLIKQIEKFESVEDQCPYCLQKVDEDHLQGELDKLHDSHDKVTKVITDNEKKINELKLQLQEVESEFQDVKLLKSEINQELQNCQQKEFELKRLAKQCVESVQRCELTLKRLNACTNPHAEKRKDLEAKMELLKQSITEHRKERLDTEKMLNAVKFWIKGFKSIRLMLISRRLIELEVVVNNYLYQLGLKQWMIEFDTIKENKSKTVRKEFNVLIHTPEVADPVPWESWSGGETQRLKLAGSLGLSSMIQACHNTSIPIEVWDEPSAWMSQKGLDDLIQTLQTRSQDLGKIIFLIDHQITDNQPFDGVYRVVKNDSGSYIESNL